MINLLPTEEKKKLRVQYALRIWATFFCVLFLLGLSAIALLTPAFILSLFKENISKDKIENLQKRENFNLDKETENYILDMNTKIDTILPFVNNKLEASDIFREILVNKDQNIKINTFSYSIGKDGIIIVQIKGISNTRESLIKFLKKLDTQNMFAKIDLPVSNFVKNKNLEFDFNLKVINKI